MLQHNENAKEDRVCQKYLGEVRHSSRAITVRASDGVFLDIVTIGVNTGQYRSIPIRKRPQRVRSLD